METEPQKHFRFIDTARGILVVMVLFFHVPIILEGSCNFHNTDVSDIAVFSTWFLPFFMPAFFVITGYCSNFEKDAFHFFLSLIRGILLPMIVLNVIPCILAHNVAAFEQFLNWDYWLWGLSFWFLPCLFLSKSVYWVVSKCIRSQIWVGIVTIIFLIFATAMEEYHFLHNYWYWKNALAFLCCIFAGQCLRKLKSDEAILRIGSVIFVVFFVLSLVLSFDIPSIRIDISYQIKNLWMFPLAAICGSYCVLYISKKISPNTILEYLGRGSLVFYCLHWMFAQNMGKMILNFWTPISFFSIFAFYLVLMLFTIALCALSIYVLDLPYLRVLIGKKA